MTIHVTPFAVKTPDVPTPRTADMFDLVEAHRRAGLYPRPVPACFQMSDWSWVMHPEIYSRLQYEAAKKSQTIRNELEQQMLYGVRAT